MDERLSEDGDISFDENDQVPSLPDGAVIATTLSNWEDPCTCWTSRHGGRFCSEYMQTFWCIVSLQLFWSSRARSRIVICFTLIESYLMVEKHQIR